MQVKELAKLNRNLSCLCKFYARIQFVKGMRNLLIKLHSVILGNNISLAKTQNLP